MYIYIHVYDNQKIVQKIKKRMSKLINIVLSRTSKNDAVNDYSKLFALI